MYIIRETTYSGCSSGSSSGVPTSPVGGALAQPAKRAADWASRGAAADAAAAATVRYFHTAAAATAAATHTSFHFFGYFRKVCIFLSNMFMYTENYIESHKSTPNINS